MVPGTVTFVNPLQLANAEFPIDVKVLGIIIFSNFNELQLLNAESSIVIKLFGNFIPVIEEHPYKALLPILVIVLGRLIVLRLLIP